jgi:hypothetical protein
MLQASVAQQQQPRREPALLTRLGVWVEALEDAPRVARLLQHAAASGA